MIAAHACWSPFGLHLWGESSARFASPIAPRGRAARGVRPHPFTAAAVELREALRGELPVARAGAGEIALHLPSRARTPLPSPNLAHAARNEGGPGVADRTAAWMVEVLSFTGAGALDVLLALSATASDGVVLGDTPRAFGELAKLALELVAGGRVLPVLERTHGGRWLARWRPVLTAEGDAERLAVIRRAMPAACAAHTPAPEDVAGRALDALVDACVRQGTRSRHLAPVARRFGQTSAAEAWRDALFAPDASPREDRAGWERLHDALAAWSRPLAPSATSGLRTCFQLTPPADPGADEDAPGEPGAAEGEAWRLEFLLQPVDDPTLLVPAEEVWRARGALTFLRRTMEQPQERLLEDLGRALRLVPGLEPALRGARPTGMAMDAEAAYAFLREGAPLLMQAGFGVRVPPWWNAPAARLGVRLRARAPSASTRGEADGRFGLDALCAYDWQVSLGGEPVSADEFAALARARVPLVRFRGRWVELRPE
ncbi:MAG TPA: SNF2 helicase-associated domain-containing protein, partial [Longimicrobium sp.]|nr:SNF2 helicase-associated domain-containing protein [Longimicrobium sp.]